MTALLTIFANDDDKVINYINECKRMGIKILPPDLNKSERGFTVEGNDMRFGLQAIKGLGHTVIEHLIEARPFDSLLHLVETMPKRQLNKKVVTVLSYSGALDSLSDHCKNRIDTLQQLYYIRGDKDDLTEEIHSFTDKQKLEYEKNLLGLYLSGHPLEDLAQPVNWDSLGDYDPVRTAGVLTSFRAITTKSNKEMAFVNLETLEGNVRFVLFPDVYEEVTGQLQKGLVIKVDCYRKYNAQYDEHSIIVKKMTIPKRINKHLLEKPEAS